MYYLIKETLVPCDISRLLPEAPYVAVLTAEQWQNEKENFVMGIDMDIDLPPADQTRAVVNYDSLTGSIAIPKMGYEEGVSGSFAFALDEKGIVFIDDSGLAAGIVESVAAGKRWRMPGLERFIFDFLEQIISPDIERLEALEQALDRMEERILTGDAEKALSELNEVRGNLLDLNLHYGQLMDFGRDLAENENDFFAEENLRYFRLFTSKVERLHDMTGNLRDYTVQLRDLIQTRVDVKQNRIITLLTVVTTIFTPLTLITGWYGMNFKYMPELGWRWSYPVVIAACAVIAIGCLIYFRKKKWM